MPTTDEFKPGQRIEIQERDRDPDRYPQATVVRAETHGQFFGSYSLEPGYIVRYDNGSEVWRREHDVLAMRSPDSRLVDAAVVALKRDGWDSPLIGDDLDDDTLRRVAQTVLRATVAITESGRAVADFERGMASQVARDLADEFGTEWSARP